MSEVSFLIRVSMLYLFWFEISELAFIEMIFRCLTFIWFIFCCDWWTGKALTTALPPSDTS